MFGKVFLVVFLSIVNLLGQGIIPNLYTFENKVNQNKVNSSLNVLAVMVEFQTDDDATTVGDGKFNSIYKKNYGNDIIDPLPHNADYFKARLEFAKRYYAQAFNNRINIDYTVLPDIYTVSQVMKTYSPPIKSSDFNGLAELTKEVWEIVSVNNPAFDFSVYDIFLIFHAGVGRDVSLPGSLGNERDLPSIYLNLDLLKKRYGNEFEGITVNNNFKIKNSIILPQTNSRELTSFGSTYLFEVTINGLLVANIASHLGLPDLFNTETGLSAIGRFGLMDGQAIFAYNGVLPPPPSAWEKIFLANRLNIDFPVKVVDFNTLVNIGVRSLADTAVIKVPISSSEYYLIENIQRDYKKDGCTLTIWNNGNTYQKYFPKDTIGFYSFAIDSLEGVIIDADDFNWALPGNGILIWHIDEKIINEKIAENKVNVDKKRRGVRVIEADGVYDIGEQFYTIFGDILIGEGGPEDLFYSSNKSELYKKNGNRFNSSTRPATLTNNGSRSLISFSEFSDTSNYMTFKIQFGDSLVKKLFSNRININKEVKRVFSINGGNSNSYYILAENDLYKLNESGDILDSIVNFSNLSPAYYFRNNTEVIIGAYGNQINMVQYDGLNKSIETKLLNGDASTNPLITTSPTEQVRVIIGTKNGYLYTFSALTNFSLIDIDSSKKGFEYTHINTVGGLVNWVIYNPTTKFSTAYAFARELNIEGEVISAGVASSSKTANGNTFVLLDKRGTFHIIDAVSYKSFSITTSEPINHFILSDIKGDGEVYLLFTDAGNIEAYNFSGARADYFPVKAGIGEIFTDKLVSADFANDSRAEVIAVTKEGKLLAYDGSNGKIINSFPIEFGSDVEGGLSLFTREGRLCIIATDKSHYLTAWEISPSKGEIFWLSDLANSYNNNFVASKSNNYKINTGFMPKERVYNYPNPVYDNKTFIRFYVEDDASVEVNIFDIAGDFVEKLSASAIGGMDNEIEWRVSGIQSGVYFASIKASSDKGNTAEVVIKIAVVK